jgi:hypothetical protein
MVPPKEKQIEVGAVTCNVFFSTETLSYLKRLPKNALMLLGLHHD